MTLFCQCNQFGRDRLRLWVALQNERLFDPDVDHDTLADTPRDALDFAELHGSLCAEQPASRHQLAVIDVHERAQVGQVRQEPKGEEDYSEAWVQKLLEQAVELFAHEETEDCAAAGEHESWQPQPGQAWPKALYSLHHLIVSQVHDVTRTNRVERVLTGHVD